MVSVLSVGDLGGVVEALDGVLMVGCERWMADLVRRSVVRLMVESESDGVVG